MEKIKVDYDTFITSLWFACSSASQTFLRTKKSKKNINLHLWRIFTGKLGEYSFLKWCLDYGIVSSIDFQKFRSESFSIYFGTTNVDSFDLVIKDYSLDIKTTPNHKNRYMIVPEDQFENHSKDIYVGLSIKHKLSIGKLFNISCTELNELFNKRRYNSFPSIVVNIHGFISKDDPKWEKSKENDMICPEKKCYKIKLSELTPIKELKGYIFRNNI